MLPPGLTVKPETALITRPLGMVHFALTVTVVNSALKIGRAGGLVVQSVSTSMERAPERPDPKNPALLAAGAPPAAANKAKHTVRNSAAMLRTVEELAQNGRGV